MQACQFALRDRVPVRQFGFLLRVEAEAGFRAFNRRNQIVNQCALKHRLSPLAGIPTCQNCLVLSLFGDSFHSREGTTFSLALYPATLRTVTTERGALLTLFPAPAILLCARAGCDRSLRLLRPI